MMSEADMENEGHEIPAEALDEGPENTGKRAKKEKADPVRKCLLSGERKPKSELIRFVVGPDRTLVTDLKAILPGRGMWISADPDALEKAAKRGLFARAAKGKVVLPDDLVGQVEKLLAKRCGENLSLANRAGQVVIGFEKVRAALKSETHASKGLVLAAYDAAEDGKRKVRQLATALNVSVSEAMSAAEIGMAFGRDQAVHAFLLPGGLTDGLMVDTTRLAGFRADCLKTGIKEEG